MDQVGRKRKRPPTFQHFPEQRAKQLKKRWVDNAKIKSKWRAQKRRQGIQASGDSGNQVGDKKHESEQESEAELSDSSESVSSDKPDDRGAAGHQSSYKDTHDKIDAEPQQSKTGLDDSENNQTSLRELSRQAYAASSLHTYKSDPLHRRKGFSQRGRGGAKGVRGRGQPNMKLRMNAMLEKIKRDLAY